MFGGLVTILFIFFDPRLYASVYPMHPRRHGACSRSERWERRFGWASDSPTRFSRKVRCSPFASWATLLHFIFTLY